MSQLKQPELEATAPERSGETLWRIGTWGLTALLMTTFATFAAGTAQGRRHINAALDFSAPPAPVAAPQQAAADPILLYETRRLAEQVRSLSTERETLAERLDSIERGMGDITASITRRPVRQAEPNAPAAEAPAPVVAASPAAEESQATRTEFAIDVSGGDTSVDALRQRWSKLRARHGALLDGLRPLVGVGDGAKPGLVELRLVAGPLTNANIAARLCASLSNAGTPCRTAVYDGQRLSLQ